MQATVIVSCYKQELYIEHCLDSILSQEVNFNFDIIVSDDCSPDTTQKILIDYQKRNPSKIKLILRKKNVGAAQNYIDAHNKAEGAIVFHFDGDDIMLPGKLQKQFDIFREDENVNLVFHRAIYFSDDGSYFTESGKPFSQRQPAMYFNVSDLALWGSITVHSAYAYRRTSRKAREINREFMEWFFAMDSLLPSGKAVYLDEILVKYRCNKNGEAYLASRSGRIKSYEIYYKDILYYYYNVPSLQNRLYANCLFTFLARYRAKCGYSPETLKFLLKNILNFRPSFLLEAFKMRASIAPKQRIR